MYPNSDKRPRPGTKHREGATEPAPCRTHRTGALAEAALLLAVGGNCYPKAHPGDTDCDTHSTSGSDPGMTTTDTGTSSGPGTAGPGLRPGAPGAPTTAARRRTGSPTSVVPRAPGHQ
jgi:hypothetical protein